MSTPPEGGPPASTTASTELGATFRERYALGRQLGCGATSEVYEAIQRALDRPVAIKFLSARHLLDPDWRERFLREARILAELTHPNLVKVFDHGVADGRPYLVTELVEGRPLSALAADFPRLPAGHVFRIAEQVLDGLEAIHARGIVHRDLKPENILVGDSLEMPVKISDFGVAKHLGASAHGPSTAKGLVLGTPAYMAPEQVAGSPPAPASDLYALAIILYQMIVGRHPFPAEGTREMLHHQLWTEAPIPWSLHPALKALLERGLAKSPAKRFASVAEFRSCLRAIENEILAEAGVVTRSSGPVRIVEPARPSIKMRALRQARRITLALGLACAGVIALALPHVLTLVR